MNALEDERIAEAKIDIRAELCIESISLYLKAQQVIGLHRAIQCSKSIKVFFHSNCTKRKILMDILSLNLEKMVVPRSGFF